ncbi:MAG TPA: FAD-dependent oxidoreductase, partial [Bradyrhizobium sp.]|nr:FAD-dependent oxidoreductase [Bradyrhizobium sp.]
LIGLWGRGSSAAAGILARYRERAREKERQHNARLAEANRQAGTRPPRPRPPPVRPHADRPRPQRPRVAATTNAGNGEDAR